MSKRGSKKKSGDSLTSDPIMTEVFDGSGNKPLPTSLERLKAKKAAKNRSPLPGTKDFNDLHYGDLKDSDESSAEDDDDDYDSSSRSYSRRKKKGYFEKIKWGHVAILCMMTMGGLAPFFFMLADNIGPAIGKYMPNLNLAPTMVNLGLMQTPKKRLVDFYQKHNQTDKLADDLVDATILKYAGDYPTLIKKLERKYQDYGYFIGWEHEGGLADVQKKTYQWVADNGGRVYQRYVPFPIRNGVKRTMFNLERFYKIAYKKLDKWTAAPAAGAKKKSKKSGSTSKSRRARNNQARDD